MIGVVGVVLVQLVVGDVVGVVIVDVVVVQYICFVLLMLFL